MLHFTGIVRVHAALVMMDGIIAPQPMSRPIASRVATRTKVTKRVYNMSIRGVFSRPSRSG